MVPLQNSTDPERQPAVAGAAARFAAVSVEFCTRRRADGD
jgi:hypothetical protein